MFAEVYNPSQETFPIEDIKENTAVYRTIEDYDINNTNIWNLMNILSTGEKTESEYLNVNRMKNLEFSDLINKFNIQKKNNPEYFNNYEIRIDSCFYSVLNYLYTYNDLNISFKITNSKSLYFDVQTSLGYEFYFEIYFTDDDSDNTVLMVYEHNNLIIHNNGNLHSILNTISDLVKNNTYAWFPIISENI